ncbi:hypothetical protein NQ176_g3428 [Zarea fungicola]|uniref:Uncharacterized protein n=1 Tax=Zarea fungicola TaxID=93591 RepID=A0ACC1NIP3_9HYPO|nr:hypothetical protein NQ176_g3428 [Lecanicillium fungicola]
MPVETQVARGEAELVAVKSKLPALPYPPPEQREAIITDRLLLRPVRESDLQAIHEMRSDPEVAQWSATGIPDAEVEVTRQMLEKGKENSLEKHDCAICLASTGQVIGVGGQHRRCGMLGWPEIGYSLKREFWGQGYGTEFLQGFLAWYWEQPRAEVDVNVDKATILDPDAAAGGAIVPDCVVATTVEENTASRHVMAKSGLQLIRLFPVTDLRDNSRKIDLLCHIARCPKEQVA